MLKKNIAVLAAAVILAAIAVSVYCLYFYSPWQTKPGENIAADPSWQIVKNRGKLIAGSDAPYGMMEFFDKDGKIVGLDVDLVNEIARRMGVAVEIRDIDWDNLFAAVKSGEVDIAISSIGINEERRKEMLFSAPYINAGQVLVIKKENADIKGPEDLKNKIVGSQKETTCIAEAAKYVKPENLKAYASFDDAADKGIFHDLKVGKLDAVVIGYEAAIGVLKNNHDLKLAGDPFTDDFSGIVTKLGNNSLMDEINKALRDMQGEGVLKSLEKKWLSPE